MELSESDLNSMSPEQISDLQKKNCIFCHIVAGQVSTKKIYEDDKVIAILDINPANPGHILLLPKKHFAIMPLVPEDIIGHMFVVAKHLSQAQLRALKSSGTTIMAANGMVAGQRAPHFMMHIIPRKEDDGVGFDFPTRQLTIAEADKLHIAIKKRADLLFGKASAEPINLDSRPLKILPEALAAHAGEEPRAEEPKPGPATRQVEQATTPKPQPPNPKPRPAPKKRSPKSDKTKTGPAQKPKPEKQEEEPDLDLISRLF